MSIIERKVVIESGSIPIDNFFEMLADRMVDHAIKNKVINNPKLMNKKEAEVNENFTESW